MKQLARAVPYLALVAALLYAGYGILQRCEGRFIYALDDAYIHLALAEGIAGETYGINPGEVSAPASSVLWPFLLAPFAWTPFFAFVPLVFNILAAFATLFVYQHFGELVLEGVKPFIRAAAAGLLAIVLAYLTNLAGLVFTGMEHSLQLLLSAAVALGMVKVMRGEQVPAWLALALVAGPLVRYELLAVAAPALALLAFRRQWRTLAVVVPALLVTLGGFSLFLYLNGLGWLPSSVMAKTGLFQPGAQLGFGYSRVPETWPEFFDRNLQANLEEDQGTLLSLLLMLLALRLFLPARFPADRLLSGMGALALLAHLLLGKSGWWGRYEVYAVAAGLMLALYLVRGSLLSLLRGSWKSAPLRGLLIAALTAAALESGEPYKKIYLDTPLASANIYEQQYQMHRFIVEYYRGPVAVNDLGWVSFRNPNYVLDLWGLGSAEALARRTRASDPGWMEDLAQSRDVRLIMIYQSWLPAPPSWIPVARLHLGQPWVVAGWNTVTFFARGAEEARRVKALLANFRQTLPAGVRLDILSGLP